jgi:hypothetical protein
VVNLHWCRWDRSLVAIAVLSAAVTAVPCFAARPPAARLLPEKTVLVASVSDCSDLARRFLNTATGRIGQDPQISPLVKQFYDSAVEAAAGMREHVGLTLPELLAIPQGEVTFAIVAPDDKPLGAVLLVDAGNKLASARTLLDRLGDLWEKTGAKKSQRTVGNAVLTVYDGIFAGAAFQNRSLVVFEKDSTIVLATGVDVAEPLLAAWSGGSARSLGDNSKYSTIMRRCSSGRDEPQILWFADPISLVRSLGQENAPVQVVVAMFPLLGLDGLSGLGGTISLDAGPLDTLSHAHLLLESPRGGLIDVIALDSVDPSPEPWVPNEVTSYMTLRWDFNRSFKGVQRLFDSIRGEGALTRELERIIQEPTGVDFVREILPSLDGRVTYLTWTAKPVTLFSQATLVGVKLKDAAAVRKALESVSSTHQGTFERQTVAGKEFFQVKMPSMERPPNAPPLPEPCFGILDNYVIFTNRRSLFERILQVPGNSAESLAAALDYKVVMSRVARQAGSKRPAMVSFTRPEQSFRFLYDLVTSDENRERIKKMAESSPPLKLLNTALESHPLPPFEVIERYLAPAGAMIVDEDTGLHYTSFTLRRK